MQLCAALAPKASRASGSLTPEAAAHVPPTYLCPIGLTPMRDPVMIAETGQTYERANIEQWLESHNTCPSTGGSLKVHPVQLIPNYSLRQSIDLWAKEQGITLPAAPVHVPVFAAGSPGASSSSTAAAAGAAYGEAGPTSGFTSSLPSPSAGSFGSFSSAAAAVGGGRSPSTAPVVSRNVSPRSTGSRSINSPAYVALDIPPEENAPPFFASGSTSYTPSGTATGSYTRAAAATNAAVAGSGPASSYYPVVDAIPGGYEIPQDRFNDVSDDIFGPDDQGHARVDVSKAGKGSTSGGAAIAGGAGSGSKMKTGKAAGTGGSTSTMEATGSVGGNSMIPDLTTAQMRRNRVRRTVCAVVLIAVILVLVATGVGLGVAFYLKQTNARQQHEALLSAGAATPNRTDPGKRS